MHGGRQIKVRDEAGRECSESRSKGRVANKDSSECGGRSGVGRHGSEEGGEGGWVDKAFGWKSGEALEYQMEVR